MAAQRVSRRSFLSVAAAASGALLIGIEVTSPARAAETTPATSLTVFLRIARDNTVTFIHPASEMGQGVLSSLTQLVAEELRLEWTAVRVEQGGNDARLGNPAFGGTQLTAGSRSIRGYYLPLRRAGAEARERLVAAAAARWSVAPGDCVADRGTVTGPGSRSATYGELAEAAATITYAGPPTLVADGDLRLIGKPLTRPDLRSKTDGSAVFGIDVRLPELLYAGVQQAPKVGQSVTGWASPPAGMKAVAVPGGVAVIGGPTTWHVLRAARDLRVTWQDGPGTASADTTRLRAQAAALLAGDGPMHVVETGQGARPAVDAAARRVTATYDVPFLAHHTLEPMNATALVRNGPDGRPASVELWAPTQAQTGAANAAARAAGIPASAVTVHTTLLGGGMGRRAANDFVSQAVTAALAVPGRPVKLVWSREEDFTHDIYRPMATARLEGGIDAAGRLTGIVARLVSPSIRKPSPTPDATDPGFDGFAFEGLEHLPYQVPQRIEWVRQPVHVPVGTWRSVGFSHNTFFVETFLDEVAVATRQNPCDLREALLAGKPRHLAVLRALRARSGWDTPPPAGRARGLAFVEGFGSIVGEVVEVSGTVSSPKVHRVTVVYDCGRVINPDTVAAQFQGAVVQGLAVALSGGMPFSAGAPTRRNFNTYKVPRLADTPPLIDVHPSDVANSAAPGGVGEPGLPCAAPALVNALYALTGTRQRSLPLS
ncbi:MAG: xanthine dehydrogenase family protein molybdopterin-binding subunit [Nonomuraea sp.]|nr:xanthine dehydrogenase family protein molybdopterin-binding subunit [Nonomuraea sp.]